jgi:hypothetical protein
MYGIAVMSGPSDGPAPEGLPLGGVPALRPRAADPMNLTSPNGGAL